MNNDIYSLKYSKLKITRLAKHIEKNTTIDKKQERHDTTDNTEATEKKVQNKPICSTSTSKVHAHFLQCLTLVREYLFELTE